MMMSKAMGALAQVNLGDEAAYQVSKVSQIQQKIYNTLATAVPTTEIAQVAHGIKAQHHLQ